MAEELKQEGDTATGQPVPVTVPDSKTRTSLSKIPPQLSEKEFASAGARKLLREELDRLDKEVAELKRKLEAQAAELRGAESKYNAADKRVAELETEARASREAQTLRTIFLSFGSILMGLTTAGWLNAPGQAVAAVAGVLFVSCAVFAGRSKR
jgi:hypothetical protein